MRLSNGATIVSLILSDVVGNPLEAIASGPTAPDPTTKPMHWPCWKNMDCAVKSRLPFWPRWSRPRKRPSRVIRLFEKVQNVIVGSSLLAAQAALAQAEMEGFHPYLLRIDLQGEARQAAFELATFLRQAKRTGDPVSASGLYRGGRRDDGHPHKGKAKAGATPNWPWLP